MTRDTTSPLVEAQKVEALKDEKAQSYDKKLYEAELVLV